MSQPSADDLYEALGTDYLHQQVDALVGDKSDTGRRLRRKLTLLGVDCRRCHKPLIDVIATRPRWSIRHRVAVSNEQPEFDLGRPVGLSDVEWGAELYDRQRAAGVHRNPGRKGPWTILPTTQNPPADTVTTLVHSVCDCGPWETTLDWIHGQLRDTQGKPRRVGVR